MKTIKVKRKSLVRSTAKGNKHSINKIQNVSEGRKTKKFRGLTIIARSLSLPTQNHKYKKNKEVKGRKSTSFLDEEGRSSLYFAFL